MKLIAAQYINRTDLYLNRLVKRLPQSIKPVMVAASTIISPVGNIIVVSIAALVALNAGKLNIVAALAMTIPAMGFIGLLKLIVRRTRPDTVFVTLSKPYGSSFPSGHAADATFTYGLLLVIAAGFIGGIALGLLAVAIAAVIFLVGVSRIWLGAHYPTDVIAGWIIGALIVALITQVTHI